MHLYPRRSKTLHRIIAGAGKTVAEHFTAKRRIGRMNRNIDRRHLHFNDSANIALIHIGKRNIISHQKRKPRIIILKIQRFSHSGRKLVDKAKYAFVAAGTLLIHKKGLKLKTDIVICRFFYNNIKKLRAAVYKKPYPWFRNIISVIKNIVNILTINPHQIISTLHTVYIGKRTGQNILY